MLILTCNMVFRRQSNTDGEIQVLVEPLQTPDNELYCFVYYIILFLEVFRTINWSIL